jgi:hypothetical protein
MVRRFREPLPAGGPFAWSPETPQTREGFETHQRWNEADRSSVRALYAAALVFIFVLVVAFVLAVVA